MAEASIEGAIEEAKWLLSTIVTGLLKESFSLLGVGISAKLQDLQTIILPQFQLVIEAGERSTEHKAKFHLWLKKLKDAVYEAEDVLDLYKYQLLKEKVSDLNTRPALKPFKRVARKVNSKLSILSPQKIKLRRSLNKLEVIAAEAKTFRELLGIRIGNDGTVAENLRERGQPYVTSFPLHDVFGREKERDEIIKYLLDPSEASELEKNYSVGAIVAIGGAGKTTLAQLVYRDTRVVKHFDVKMWVCVSRKLDLAKHTKDMIESSGKSERPNLGTLQAMQSKLVELVKSKKILLVLDDVWFDRSTEETEREWQTLVAPLANSVKSGSKVLVTTRTKNLPVALRPQRPQFIMELKDLEDNHILSLFMLFAFGSTELDGSRLQDELMSIGKQIVRKLYGSPLAAKAVGCQLRKTLNVGAWKRALLDGDNLRDSRQALLWSYQRLDAPLQRCFSYFSLFSKGHRYDVDELIYLWIAEGFINSTHDDKRAEDIAMDYFNELVSLLFLQYDEVEYHREYHMHDLFHDLAENLSKNDYLRIEDYDREKKISPTIRHLSILGGPTMENNMSFNKLEKLRTLIIGDGSLSSDVTANLLAATEKLKKLRVLMIDYVSEETLTKLLPNLKHLRFLSFQLNYEDKMPAALGKLYHLQVLDTPYNDASLPRSVKHLINLRHFRGGKKAPASLPHIGRLTSLQGLAEFVVNKEKGHGIGQLKNLNELRGRLNISNLKNVEGKNMAVEANLKDKRYLESLLLKWDSDDDDDDSSSDNRRDLDMKVLEGLQPHPNLTKLTIEGYKSPTYPSWLLQEGCLTTLTHLSIYSLPSISSLPEHLPRSLSELQLWDCPSISSLSEHLPQSLSELQLWDCPSISSLPEYLPQSLNRLKLRDCPSISSLPKHLPQSLNWLNLYNCPSISSLPEHLPQSLNSLELDNCPNISSLPELLPQSLNSLHLSNCPSISSLPEHLPQSLNSLRLFNCFSISSLPKHLPQSLRGLRLRDCPCISSLPEHLPQSLNWLKLYNCPSISSLPKRLPRSLNSLELDSCPKISSLPKHLSQSLRELHLWDCPSISSLPKHLPQSLNSLKLWDCSSISSLPEHLPQSLNSLNLYNCPFISSLPKHLPQSLRAISIERCQILDDRCRSPNGEDWPKIAHIPRRYILSRVRR